jgi:beta-lactamase class C
MGADYATLMQERLLTPLGLTSTYINVPADRMADYAQGYTEDGKPIRLGPGELWQEAYGVRTTAADLVRYLEANMNLIDVAPDVQHALIDTHTGYFKTGAMTQDLIWEQYPYPVALRSLLAGTAEISDAVPATPLKPPERPRQDVWINKTGSTNGFTAYVAFVPAKRLGIVLLANKSFSLPERVTASYQILTALAAEHSGAVRP